MEMETANLKKNGVTTIQEMLMMLERIFFLKNLQIIGHLILRIILLIWLPQSLKMVSLGYHFFEMINNIKSQNILMRFKIMMMIIKENHVKIVIVKENRIKI